MDASVNISELGFSAAPAGMSILILTGPAFHFLR